MADLPEVPAQQERFAIVGLGVADLHYHPEHSPRTMQTEAVRLAIEDAGLRPQDVDGAINCRGEGGLAARGIWTDAFPRILGLPVNFYFSVSRGGAVATIGLVIATRFLQLGLANYVAIAYAGDHLTQWRKRRPEGRMHDARPGLWGAPFGDLTAVSHHSFFASRHMYEYGTTSKQLGAIAVAERQWGCLNPSAQMYLRPITIEHHQNSPWVAWPYHLLDMCLVSDGGTAVIVTTAERAKACRKPPIYIMGVGFGEAMRKLWWDKENYTQLDVQNAKDAAFRQAGIGVKDVDIALLYDCFTSEVLFQLEGYGWCGKGEGGLFVEAGNIAPGGTIPVNTGGGLLSSYHHLDFTGLAEAIVQLRKEAGARQVSDPEIALVSGHGGEILQPGMCSIHSALILRS